MEAYLACIQVVEWRQFAVDGVDCGESREKKTQPGPPMTASCSARPASEGG